MDLYKYAEQFGPFVAFTIYFVWQGWQREKAQAKRIRELTDFCSCKLLEKLTEVNTTLQQVNKTLHEIEDLLNAR